MTEENNEPTPSSIGVFPTSQGIGLQTSDGVNTIQVHLSIEDASQIAINLITNIVMYQMNSAMRAAQERAEVERIKQSILQGANNVPIIKK